MTDLAVTAANVVAGVGAVKVSGTAGVAITAGQPVYLDSATNTLKLTDNNGAAAAGKKALGLALNGAAVNQPVLVAKSGPVNIGATLVPGTAYFLSGTPGGICTAADLTTGMAVCELGIAASASILNLNIQAPGVTL